MNIYLLGKHSNRTPFSYSAYNDIFISKGVRFVSDILESDFIIVGFKVDLYENFNDINRAINVNSNLKVVVLSEEPLWDSLWSSGFDSKVGEIKKDGIILTYYNANHFTSDIFDFKKIPYFLSKTISCITLQASSSGLSLSEGSPSDVPLFLWIMAQYIPIKHNANPALLTLFRKVILAAQSRSHSLYFSLAFATSTAS